MRSGPARTSMLVCHSLFSVTISVGRARARTAMRCTPGSSGGMRKRTVVRSPLSPTRAASVATTRPSASTVICTGSRPAPRMRTSASTTLDAPANVRRGACTRSIATSRAKRSVPTPTVNTGTRRARNASSASSSAPLPLSAPSDTITTPASGMPFKSSRTSFNAWARSERVPFDVSAAAPTMGEASAAKRKRRIANFSASCFDNAPVSAKVRCNAAVRVPSFTSRMRMLRESSMMIASTLRCGTADAITSPGRNRQPSTRRMAAARTVARMARSAGRNERTRA